MDPSLSFCLGISLKRKSLVLTLGRTSLKNVTTFCLEVSLEQHFVTNRRLTYLFLVFLDGKSTTQTIYPVSIKRQFHVAYFNSLAIILLSLELVFWTANPTRIKMMKTRFGDAGIWNRALMGLMLGLQAFIIISFPVLVQTTDMDNIKPKEAASLGFASTIVFYISRVYVIETIDDKN